ncbi:MAG: CapA family protein [Caldilineaceae bacterium]
MNGSKCVFSRWYRSFFFVAGLLLGVVLLASCVTPLRVPTTPTPENVVPTYTSTPVAENVDAVASPMPTDAPVAEVPDPPLTVGISPLLGERDTSWLMPTLISIAELTTDSGPRPVTLLDRAENAALTVTFVPRPQAADSILLERYFAPVVPFDTVNDETTLAQLAARWRGEEDGGLIAPLESLAELTGIFGVPPADSVNVTSAALIFDALTASPGAIGIVAFDDLHPRFKVLAVDGANVLSNQLDAVSYPLAAALVTQGDGAAALSAQLAGLAPETTNRHADQLTTLIMTGVTAMSRVTALRMEQRGYTYPALVISDTLAAADITHISNEVPFLDDCVVNASENNLVLCSDTTYWAALEAVGTDIVGLSGNHVNDFGRDGARRSITWYRDNNIPIYGGGMNIEEACAPLMWEHNGNTFAFIATLAFEPSFAWATEDQPGACYYYNEKERIFDLIAEVRPQVDIVAVELQYLETYNPYPTPQQVIEFRELREQGVDIVTGVQSHVPQAMEPYAPNADRNASIIVYGLGNLFFDQMWSWQTRTELMARHTIYQGKLLSTEILTAVLEDYAQPRWTTPAERADLLRSIFNAAPAR